MQKEPKKIKTIIFDIGNVLMTFNFMPYIKGLLEDDQTIENVIGALWGTGYWNQLDLGMDTEEVFSRMIQARPEYEKEIRKTLAHVGDCMDRKDYAIPWIRGLKERGYQIPAVVFHNVNSWQMQAPVRAKTRGTALTSGAGTAAFHHKFDGNITPLDHMLRVLGSDRYKPVRAYE